VILDRHVLPHLGGKKLDGVRYAEVQDFKLKLLSGGLARKTVNNILTVLRRMLEIARKRELIAVVPEMEWLKVPASEFDFLTVEEAERLVAAAKDEWRAMILVALRTGFRQGELLGLRWDDVDLTAGRLTVRRNIVRGRVGPPKSGKPHEVPLSPEAVAVLKSHRHLRGEPKSSAPSEDGPSRRANACIPCGARASARGSGASAGMSHVRQPSRHARRTAQSHPGAARARHDHDDDALCAPRARGHPRCGQAPRFSWHQRGTKGRNGG
jgi:integrase